MSIISRFDDGDKVKELEEEIEFLQKENKQQKDSLKRVREEKADLLKRIEVMNKETLEARATKP